LLLGINRDFLILFDHNSDHKMAVLPILSDRGPSCIDTNTGNILQKSQTLKKEK